MIDRGELLSDLQKLLQRLEADLLERSESADVPEVGKTLRAEYDRAKTAERTAQNYEDWRTDAITQAAAAWVLSCVFVRFLEDNRLIDPPKIAGPEDRLARARDEHELYFRKSPQHTDREYLLAVFDQFARLPGAKDVFGEHNPIRELPNWLSGDAAGEMLRFFQKIDANTGSLVHEFTDPKWDARFLGDLYQDLSEAARKKYALLQTPEFVEEFILDRTLDPALDEFGLEQEVAPANQPALPEMEEHQTLRTPFKMIDPACGSGHFLLGAFPRILDRWQRREPGTNVRELVQRTLNSIHGVDVNPYAVAITRFRLLLAAMRACGIQRLDKNVPGFTMNLACGDSLLHAPLHTGQQVLDFELSNGDGECEHAYQSEELPVLKRILRGGQYHAVVANPPYITPKDRQLNERYRKRFKSCHMKYSLAVPFLERIFRLSIPSGYTGQITANSFMKREFGKKLIEHFLPEIDLTHVVDLAGGGGAHIPGHTTPTVILFGRNRPPFTSTIRTVMGIRGEPSVPVKPERGLYWTAVLGQIDIPNSVSAYVSVADSQRQIFFSHPWSIGGGGAAELKETLDVAARQTVTDIIDTIGITSFPMEDGIFLLDTSTAHRKAIPRAHLRPMIVGDAIRDWTVGKCELSVFPYDTEFRPIDDDPSHPVLKYCWICRTTMARSTMFAGKSKVQSGMRWYEFGRLTADKLKTPLSIAFALIATHNHFVLDRGGSVFKNSTYVIKLLRATDESLHIILTALLNSSLAAFWLKQVCFPKGTSTGDISKDKGKPEANRYDFGSQAIHQLPLPAFEAESSSRLLKLGQMADAAARKLMQEEPLSVFRTWGASNGSSLRVTMKESTRNFTKHTRELLLIQEEIDWEVYRMFNIVDGGTCSDSSIEFGIEPDIRPFLWDSDTASFSEPEEIKAVFERRRQLIRNDPRIQLIENANCKRLWLGRQGVYGSTRSSLTDRQKQASRSWMCDRLESYSDFDGRMNDDGLPTAKCDITLVSIAQLADIARHDDGFLQVGEFYRDDAAFDVQALVGEFVAAECVPLLPMLRYKPSGLIKRGTWERTWDFQRQEDAIDARMKLSDTDPEHLTENAARELKRKQVGNIPVPTKYDSKDFVDSNFWRLRGKLDVPKERWISFPHCEGPDGTLVICWAGYDHLQQARAISAYYVRVQTEFGGTDDARLIPLLACLIELLPWLKQWHNEPDAAFDGLRMGDYFEGFINEEARQLNKTIPEIKSWTPPARAGRRTKK